MHEPTRLNRLVCLHLVQPLEGAERQCRIRMEKEQPLPVRLIGTGIHLRGAAL